MASESTLRYIKVDFQSHKDALLQRVRARWPRAWNDFLSNSFGIVLVDIVAYAMATMAFLINRIAGETFVGTMTLRESAVRIGQLVGYRLHNPIPAVVYCEATLPAALSSNVTIAKGTQIRSSDRSSLTFEVATDYLIEAGQLTPQIPVATFSPTASGQGVVNSFLAFTSGSTAVDVVDSTINLSEIIQAGQSLNKDGESTVYTVVSLESVPGAVSPFTRIVLDRSYEGTTENAVGVVVDRRIALIQGQSLTDRFVAPADEMRTPGYTVQLTRTPVIDDSITVTVNGEQWTEVDASVFRNPEDKVFTVQTFTSGRTAVTFGDGKFGALVPADASITVDYRVGGGVSGNVGLGAINTSLIGITEDTSSPVSIAVANTTSTGVGGQDSESLEEARVMIPYYSRTGDRCVTVADYQTLAQRFTSSTYGSVAYARATVRNENALLEGNLVIVYAWTTGTNGGLVALPAQLKLALKEYLQERAVGTDYVEIFDGTNRPVPISLRFRTFSGFSVTDTRNLVVDTINDYVTELRPGNPVVYSDLLRAIDEVYGVDSVNVATPNADLIPSNDTELFTVPDDSFVYEIEKTGIGTSPDSTIGIYTAQLPVFPLAAWSIRLFLGTTELTILPYYRTGYARILGANLSTDESTDDDADGLPDYHSTVNLLTGQVRLCITGAAGDFTMKLVSVQGYSSDRVVNAYIGYLGDNTLTKRREIRAILRAWSDQHGIGQAMYARRVAGITASNSSIEDVLASIEGVTTISRVALETPASTEDRVVALDYELIRLGNIVINNQAD